MKDKWQAHNTRRLSWKKLLLPRLILIAVVLAAIGLVMGALSAEAAAPGNPTMTPTQNDQQAVPAAAEGFVAEYRKIPISLYYDEVKDAIRSFENERYEEAFERLNKTARWGEKVPQYVLAVMYYQGLGTEEDDVQGLAWLILANESGNRKWKVLLDDALEHMPEDQIAAGRALAEEYTRWYGIEVSDINCTKRDVAGSRVKTMDCRKKKLGNQQNFTVLKEFPI